MSLIFLSPYRIRDLRAGGSLFYVNDEEKTRDLINWNQEETFIIKFTNLSQFWHNRHTTKRYITIVKCEFGISFPYRIWDP